MTPKHLGRRGASVGVPPEEPESSAEPRSESVNISRAPIPRRFRPTRPARQLNVVSSNLHLSDFREKIRRDRAPESHRPG